jgi:CheY-like chemotaxis protein
MKITPRTDPPSGALRRFSVLLVDDDRAILESTAATLETEHHVVTASSALLALRHLKSAEFQVVVTDWMMPGMNGLEFVQRLLELELPVGVMFLTARPEDLLAETSADWRKEAGVSIASKTARPEQLLDNVRLLGRVAQMKSSVRKLREKRTG